MHLLCQVVDSKEPKCFLMKEILNIKEPMAILLAFLAMTRGSACRFYVRIHKIHNMIMKKEWWGRKDTSCLSFKYIFFCCVFIDLFSSLHSLFRIYFIDVYKQGRLLMKTFFVIYTCTCKYESSCKLLLFALYF